jgi:hypothetical protein
MSYPAGDNPQDWYEHWSTCADNLCGTWPHRWARTLDGERYIAGQQDAEQAERERRAYR